MEQKLKEIIEHYGVTNQQKKLAEEVFELQEAITKQEKNISDFELYRCETAYNAKRYIKDIVGEIADVFVILGQFIEHYKIDTKEINDIMNFKINRQLERINKE